MPRIFDVRQRCLKRAEWPRLHRRAWDLALRERDAWLSTHAYVKKLSLRSIQKHEEGWGRYLGFRRYIGCNDDGTKPQDCVTASMLDRYFFELIDLGNRPFTVVGRFQELQAALRIMDPRGDYAWVSSPRGNSLRSELTMEKRYLEIHHPADLFLWGIDLMDGAMELNGPRRRQVRLRDGLIIAMEALRGLRLRSMLSLRLGDSIYRDDESSVWRLAIPPEDVKNFKYIAGALTEILTPWIDRYVGIERQELLNGKSTSAFWINWDGEPLGEIGLDKRIRSWSGKQFGAHRAFGCHRFRHCIGSTLPLLAPEHPELAATLLRISHGVAREHYDRSEDVLAFRKFQAAVDTERKDAREAHRDLFGNFLGKNR